MELNDGLRLLKLFGIVKDEADEAGREVGNVLARFLANGAISLAELQTARDIVARKGVTDPWAYVFLAVMFLSLRGGNAYLNPARIDNLAEKAGYREDEPQAEREAFETSVKGLWQKTEEAASALVGDVVVKGDGRWFFQKNKSAVDAIRKGIANRMNAAAGGGFVPVALSKAELREAITFTDPASGNAYALNADQKTAVEKVAAQRLTVVTGGPGTGKTTVVCSFLRALFARGVVKPADVALAAPTARAGQRMGEAIRKQCMRFGGKDDPVRKAIEILKGQTIHSLLGGYPPNWTYAAENRLPHKLVIVDETSMVDINLMKALLDALEENCRLVLLGDGDQLPSVDAGAVLGDLVGGADGTFLVKLRESNRFTGRLAACAQAINDKTEGLAESQRWQNFVALSTDVALKPAEDWVSPLLQSEMRCFRAVLPANVRPDLCHQLVVKWAEDFGLLKGGAGTLLTLAQTFPKDDESLTAGRHSKASDALFAALDRSRILTVVREGAFGARGVNELLVKKRYGGRLPANPYDKAGVPVIVTRNARARNLFNGDIGVTVKGENGMEAIFPRGDEVVVCPVDLLPEHDLGYAITVHKSQGSEFDNVLVLLPNREENPLLSRPLVYTGITRAKKRAVVVGTEKALTAALAKKLERDTGIALDNAATDAKKG